LIACSPPSERECGDEPAQVVVWDRYPEEPQHVDRTANRHVFHGITPDVAKNVMARAWKAAGIVHRHPHDLRHRYASIQIGRGVPVTNVAGQLGHTKKSMTLDLQLRRLGRTRSASDLCANPRVAGL
jgi:integrase